MLVQPTKRRGKATDGIEAIRRLLALTLTLGALCAPQAAHAGLSHEQIKIWRYIHAVFPKRYTQARQVFWCESRYHTWARNPSSGAIGVPQFLPSWIPYFHDRGLTITGGHGWEQLVAAHLLFRASGFTWQQWVCQPG